MTDCISKSARSGRLTVVAGTHTGRMRTFNEDAILTLLRPDQRVHTAALIAVADGMGGHHAGATASRLAVDTLREQLIWIVDVPVNDIAYQPQAPPIAPVLSYGDSVAESQTTHLFLEQHLTAAIDIADRAVFDLAAESTHAASSPGTTLTCALIVGSTAIVANVGDSRTYHLHKDRLTLVTHDHSLVNMLVQMGQIKADAIYDHPRRNVITRSLGDGRPGLADIWAVELAEGDRLLLCSDGLWEGLREPHLLRRLLRIPDLETAVRSLIHRANQRSGADNISLIVAEYG